MVSAQSRLGHGNATEFLPVVTDSNADAEAWTLSFITDLLDGTLTINAFDQAVSRFLARDCAKISAPMAAAETMLRIERTRRVDGHYGDDCPELNFRSLWLVGSYGKPGAIYIDAPAENSPGPRSPDRLNRPLHLHDSGRMALILHGKATFLAGRSGEGDARNLVRIEVGPGDLLFWPAGTAHSFDAQEGFGLLSGMGAYISPDQDGFSLPLKSAALR